MENDKKRAETHFKPAWWLTNSHLQTVWPTLCRRKNTTLNLRRERLELKDGDFVDLTWTGTDKGPIVIILHGLEGSIHSPYATGMLRALEKNGWRGVFMHFRCCSNEMNRLSRSYHSGDTGDLAELVAELRSREPQTDLAAIGFSLGGNVLLKWLGETGLDNPLKAAVAISVPFDLAKVAKRIEKGFSRIYQWYFLRSLRKKISRKFSAKIPPFPFPPLKKLKTIREFDDKVTAPLNGFQDVDDYYQKSSSRQFLKSINVNTLLLQAKDDPFMTPDVLPTPQELSPHVLLELTDGGGHVGFISGTLPWKANYWLEERVPEFLAKHL